LAQEYSELKENPLFQKLILQGYLDKLSKIEELILIGVSRDEDITDLKKDYQERVRFKEYLSFLESGENSWFYKEMHRRAQEGGLTDEDIAQIHQVYNRRE
jgi:hypothetical protein